MNCPPQPIGQGVLPLATVESPANQIVMLLAPPAPPSGPGPAGAARAGLAASVVFPGGVAPSRRTGEEHDDAEKRDARKRDARKRDARTFEGFALDVHLPIPWATRKVNMAASASG